MTNTYKCPLKVCALSYSLDILTNSFSLTHICPVSCVLNIDSYFKEESMKRKLFFCSLLELRKILEIS